MPMSIKNSYTCPICGHSVGWHHRLSVGVFSQWSCKNCGTLLGFNYWKSLILIPLITVAAFLCTPYVNIWILIVFYVFGMFLALNPIVEKRPRQKPDSE